MFVLYVGPVRLFIKKRWENSDFQSYAGPTWGSLLKQIIYNRIASAQLDTWISISGLVISFLGFGAFFPFPILFCFPLNI